MSKKIIALGVDHGGFALKAALVDQLGEMGVAVHDCGTSDTESVDYPDYAYKVAEVMAAGGAAGAATFGLVICGTGIGMSIAMNRYSWVRAALCHDVTSARLSRAHNDANVLALGARVIGPEVARDCLTAFLQTSFEGGRHKRRVGKLLVPPALPQPTDTP